MADLSWELRLLLEEAELVAARWNDEEAWTLGADYIGNSDIWDRAEALQAKIRTFLDQNADTTNQEENSTHD